jgi:hypothetical protein
MIASRTLIFLHVSNEQYSQFRETGSFKVSENPSSIVGWVHIETRTKIRWKSNEITF